MLNVDSNEQQHKFRIPKCVIKNILAFEQLVAKADKVQTAERATSLCAMSRPLNIFLFQASITQAYCQSADKTWPPCLLSLPVRKQCFMTKQSAIIAARPIIEHPQTKIVLSHLLQSVPCRAKKDASVTRGDNGRNEPSLY